MPALYLELTVQSSRRTTKNRISLGIHPLIPSFIITPKKLPTLTTPFPSLKKSNRLSKMVSKRLISAITFFLADYAAESLTTQMPLGLWRSKSSPFSSDNIAALKEPYRFSFAYPQYHHGENDPTYNYNDELKVSWDEHVNPKPSSLHIQCWDKEPSASENVSLCEQDISTPSIS